MLEIDPKLLLDTWDEDFCKECYNIKNKYVKDYFNEKGGRYNDFKELEYYVDLGLKRFTDIFYLPNIEVLDFFARNRDRFRDKVILDNGCGAGLLVIFLRNIGLNSIGFDTYATINKDVLNSISQQFKMESFFVGVDYLKSYNIDVLIDIGSNFSEEYLLDKVTYLLFDWRERFERFLHPKGFVLEDKYSWRLEIHKKGSIS